MTSEAQSDQGAKAPMGRYRRMALVLRGIEPVVLVAVPVSLVACALTNVSLAGGLTLVVAIGAIALMLVSYEVSRPALRQIMPTVTLGALAAAGRILFAPLPEIKPVSAICIVAGATLGRRNGFMVGALAALVSNFFFGQGAWTPWQMYGWGMVGYLSGVLAQLGVFGALPTGSHERDGHAPAGEGVPSGRGGRPHRVTLVVWGFLSAMFYGLILNGWYVIGFVHPITWPAVLAAYAAGFWLDCLHGVATVGFLLLIWEPWGRAIARVVAKYGL